MTNALLSLLSTAVYGLTNCKELFRIPSDLSGFEILLCLPHRSSQTFKRLDIDFCTVVVYYVDIPCTWTSSNNFSYKKIKLNEPLKDCFTAYISTLTLIFCCCDRNKIQFCTKLSFKLGLNLKKAYSTEVSNSHQRPLSVGNPTA